MTVDGDGNDDGTYSSIATNSYDCPAISYYDSSNTALKTAWRDGAGTWHRSTVDNTADVGRYTSIALDSRGCPHISYYDTTNDNLKYAAPVSPGSIGFWRNVGGSGYFFLDMNGNGHWDGAATDTLSGPFGTNTDTPIIGEWSGL